MSHEHNHNQASTGITGLNKAFIISIVLNFGYVLVQVVVGFKINSLSLLSDAGHNFFRCGKFGFVYDSF
jgi:cobalt-zinc-cadmium efflux system protein